MTKLLLPLLALAAFLYAVWLVVFRLRLPNPQQASGVRKRFYLSVLLFVGFLTVVLAPSCGRGRSPGSETPAPECYKRITATHPAVSAQKGALATLAAVWLTLDPKEGEDFRNKLEAAVQQAQVKADVSQMLLLAFKNLAYHKENARGEGRMVKCYKMTRLGGALMGSRESAYKQLELLTKARETGKIDKETAEKCQAVLARELEMLSQGSGLESYRDVDSEAEKKLMDQYSKGELKPGETAQEAAAFIVRLESGQADTGGEDK